MSALRIGLTGGIGSGKSTVARMLADLGAVVIDADAISRELMEPGQAVLAATVEVFGADILQPDGSLNRQALAAKVFTNDGARQKLNDIVHPAVRQRSQELIAEAEMKPGFSGIIVEDIPLLVETGQASRFDGIIVVEAEAEIRIERLVRYRNFTREDALARIKAQATDEQRRAIATWVIDNSEETSETQRQVRKIWDLFQRLSKNAR